MSKPQEDGWPSKSEEPQEDGWPSNLDSNICQILVDADWTGLRDLCEHATCIAFLQDQSIEGYRTGSFFVNLLLIPFNQASQPIPSRHFSRRESVEDSS